MRILSLFLIGGLFAIMASCTNTGTSCETTITSAADNANLEVCTPAAGRGHHFRVEDIDMSDPTLGSSRFLYLGIGYDAGRTATPGGTTGENRFTLIFGKSNTGTNQISAGFDQNVQGAGTVFPDPSDTLADFLSGPKTVCFDLTTSAPVGYTLWVTGKNGADCKKTNTLTTASAVYSKKSDWPSNAAAVDGTTYTRKSGSSGTRVSASKIYVSSMTAAETNAAAGTKN